MKKVVMLLCLFLFTVSVMLTRASPAVGVTPTLIGRGTFDPFKLKSDPHSLVDFQAKSKSPMDIVVRTHDYSAGDRLVGIPIPGRCSSPSSRGRSPSTSTMTDVYADNRVCRSGICGHRRWAYRAQRNQSAGQGRIRDLGPCGTSVPR